VTARLDAQGVCLRVPGCQESLWLEDDRYPHLVTPTVLVVSQPGEAGVAHVVADQVAWAVTAGWDCVVACDPNSRLAELTRRRGARVVPWTAARSPTSGFLRNFLALRRIVTQSRPDVVHLHSSKAGLVGRLVLRGRCPTLFQPHAWSFQAATGVQKLLAVKWERYAERWTEAVVCVSRAEMQQGASAGLTCAMVLLPNAVDSRRFRPADVEAPGQENLRASLGLAGRPLAVCLGRICRQKGQDLLLEAWSRVTSALPEAELVLVGDGCDRGVLSAAAPAGVTFVGAVDNPVPWLQIADVVAVPSRWEGQALVVLEAMACATAVVASDIAPNIETLPPSAGAIVSANDPELFALALRDRLTQQGRARARGEGLAGRRHVISHHDPAEVGHRLLSLYAETVATTSSDCGAV